MSLPLLISPLLSTPISYHWGPDTYEICPDCIVADETRRCDVETIVSWVVCERHVGW
jgi:hypothetical protein